MISPVTRTAVAVNHIGIVDDRLEGRNFTAAKYGQRLLLGDYEYHKRSLGFLVQGPVFLEREVAAGGEDDVAGIVGGDAREGLSAQVDGGDIGAVVLLEDHQAAGAILGINGGVDDEVVAEKGD